MKEAAYYQEGLILGGQHLPWPTSTLYTPGEERCFEFMCAGIGQDVVLSIPSGWCDVAVGMLASWCVILYSMLLLECWRRCFSVSRCRCWSMVVMLACLL